MSLSSWPNSRTRLCTAAIESSGPLRPFPFPMLPTRLLRSARPLSTLFFHQRAASLHSSPSFARVHPRFYSDSVTNAPPNTRHLTPNATDSINPQQPDEPKYSLTFTCKVPSCDERSSHMFSKRAYHHGIVIIQCPKCENRCVASQTRLTCPKQSSD